MGHVRIVHCHQFGIGRVGHCKNAIAGLEVLHICAHRPYDATHVDPELQEMTTENPSASSLNAVSSQSD
jgi:hypothetical protein